MAKNTPQQTIIVKKIINAAGHHGGSWKVAFADFMTAMMAFFLVMWLVSQSDEVKQNVASYFSGPSMLGHEFSSFGAKLTLEKLFMDLINEPLGTLQKLMQPADFTPNIIAMGNQEIVVHQIAAEMGFLAKDVTIQQDKIEFSVYDYMLFQVGEAKISNQFVEVMEKVRKLVVGLENSVFTIESEIYMETVPGRSIQVAEQIALQRAHILKKYVESAIKSPSVSVKVNTNVKKAEVLPPSGLPAGSITFSFQQKEFLPDGKSPRKINVNMGVEQIPQRVYEDIVNKIEEQRKRRRR